MSFAAGSLPLGDPSAYRWPYSQMEMFRCGDAMVLVQVENAEAAAMYPVDGKQLADRLSRWENRWRMDKCLNIGWHALLIGSRSPRAADAAPSEPEGKIGALNWFDYSRAPRNSAPLKPLQHEDGWNSYACGLGLIPKPIKDLTHEAFRRRDGAPDFEEERSFLTRLSRKLFCWAFSLWMDRAGRDGGWLRLLADRAKRCSNRARMPDPSPLGSEGGESGGGRLGNPSGDRSGSARSAGGGASSGGTASGSGHPGTGNGPGGGGAGGGGDYDPAAGGNFDDDVSYISLSSQPSIFAAVETLEDAVVGSSQPTEPLGSAYNGRLRRSSRIEQRARRKAKPRPGKAEKQRSSKIRSRSEWERAPE